VPKENLLHLRLSGTDGYGTTDSAAPRPCATFAACVAAAISLSHLGYADPVQERGVVPASDWLDGDPGNPQTQRLDLSGQE
jgi:hypothetical protein